MIGSDIAGMEAALDAGLWSDPFIDPETSVSNWVIISNTYHTYLDAKLRVFSCQ
jgi:hypothetical protein